MALTRIDASARPRERLPSGSGTLAPVSSISSKTSESAVNQTTESAVEIRIADDFVLEFYGHIRHDDDNVFTRFFKIDRVSDEALAIASAALDNEATDYLYQYQNAWNEEEAYEPMATFIQIAADAVETADHAPYRRPTRVTGNRRIKSDATAINPNPPSLITFDCHDHHYSYRHSGVHWELKWEDAYENATESDNLNDVLGSIANSVRLRMVSRPHQLFSLVVIMCRDGYFWVSMWDRDGVVVSKRHHIRANRDMFLRVVIATSCLMDFFDLGLDSNPNLEYPSDFSFSHASPGPAVKLGEHRWELVQNIFHTTALAGPGSTLWLARREQDGEIVERVLQISWNSDICPSGSKMQRIVEELRGAHDVQLPTVTFIQTTDSMSDTCTFYFETTMVGLRDGLSSNSAPVNNYVWSYTILARAGKSIWCYETDLELLTGARDILKGLAGLHDAHWLHRNICASTCLLSRDRKEGPSFILGLQFATNTGNEKLSEWSVCGSPEFKAVQVLESIGGFEPSGTHAPLHDLESFVYLLTYAVMKKECADILHQQALPGISADARASLDQKFTLMEETLNLAFGQDSTLNICNFHRCLYTFWNKHMRLSKGTRNSTTLHKTISQFLGYVRRDNIGLSPEDLWKTCEMAGCTSHQPWPVFTTGDVLSKALDTAIRMEKSANMSAIGSESNSDNECWVIQG